MEEQEEVVIGIWALKMEKENKEQGHQTTSTHNSICKSQEPENIQKNKLTKPDNIDHFLLKKK